MVIELSPSLQSKVDRLISEGEYHDPESVIEAALNLLQLRDERLRWLRREVQLGIDQIERGEFVEYTPELMDRLLEEATVRSSQKLAVKDAVKP